MESADDGKRLSPPSSSLPTSSDSLPAAATEAPESTTRPRKHDEDIAIGTLEPGLNQTSPAVERGDGRSSSDMRTSPAATLGEVDITGKGLGPPSSLPEHPSQLNGSISTGNDLRTDPVTTLGEANLSTTGSDKFSTYSVSDGSEATDFALGANATTLPQAGVGPGKLVDSQVASDCTDEDLLVSSMPKNDSATQSPPTQVMERPGDPDSSSAYRIPDYVFARNKSTAPMEWSTASNESLFSIHMGNMSFTRDQFPWLGKSGELGLPGEVNMYGCPSPCNIDFSSNQPPSKQSAEKISQKTGNLDEEPSPRVTEAKAAETMREVIMENAENSNAEKSNAENHDKGNASVAEGGKYHSACLSHASDGSTRSFAFPVLAGDGDVNCSLRGDATKQKQQSPPERVSQHESRPQTPKESPNTSPTPKSSTPNVPKCRWISCFSCCPSCCT